MNKDTEMYHAAINILSNRADQLGLDEDELMHYGRKGMKWNETIFTDEDRARGQDIRLKQKGQRIRAEQKANREKINEMKANVLVEKARREGRGGGIDHPTSKPNIATMDEVNTRRDDLNSKKNELLSKSYAERDAREAAANKSSEPKYNGMTTREHLANLTSAIDSNFPGGLHDYATNMLTTAVDVDKAYGTDMSDEEIQEMKDEFRVNVANSINQYINDNNIPESEYPKFQTLFDSYAGQYDDAVDAAFEKGAYNKLFGNRKNKYRAYKE